MHCSEYSSSEGLSEPVMRVVRGPTVSYMYNVFQKYYLQNPK